QIDLDGSEVLSRTIQVNISGITGISIFPNPATWHFWVKGQADSGELKIYSLAGQLMLSAPIPDEDGMLINCKEWPKGVYLLVAGGERKRMIIQ
ncbi:MAG: T9SS type A sorting domain-containing protein, partial [Lewinella sp.]